MQILRAADYKVMPWKNGLGSTTEIAISPPHASLGDFDWRVSMAQVTSDGPFSSFADIDRTLVVLEGAGIDLEVADQTPKRIDRDTIHSFPGDQPTSARLIDGPIVDLNVMSRRRTVTHTVQRIKFVKRHDFIVSAQTFLFAERGAVRIVSPTLANLDAGDAALIDAVNGPIIIEASDMACLIIAEFR